MTPVGSPVVRMRKPAQSGNGGPFPVKAQTHVTIHAEYDTHCHTVSLLRLWRLLRKRCRANPVWEAPPHRWEALYRYRCDLALQNAIALMLYGYLCTTFQE